MAREQGRWAVTFATVPGLTVRIPAMRQFLRDHFPLVLIILAWVFVAFTAAPLLYAVLPLTVLLFRRRDMWQEILFGLLICLVLSDMSQDIRPMRVMKTAKYAYVLILAVLVLLDQARMQPMARIFGIFLPFFIYAFFPIVWSPVPVLAVEKTLSYAIIFLVVPNIVLLNFRLYGWDFFKNLIWFIMLILLSQQVLPYIAPESWSFIADRFRGYFGNPNGLAIFVYLTFVLFAVLNHLRRDLFTVSAKVFIYAVLIYYVITCGARTSLMSTLMFVVFIQVFRISIFLGIISFFAFLAIGELVSNNLPAILTALGLQDYMRVDTLRDGSGRYYAWRYAWDQLNQQGFFLFGGGFDNEGTLMYEGRAYLAQLGHQGGVHNTYLAFWLNTGIVGLLLFLRSLFLVFIKASKNTSISMAILFSVLFSILYESWLAGSLNPYTIMLLVILTIVSEEEINEQRSDEEAVAEPLPTEAVRPPLLLPAR